MSRPRNDDEARAYREGVWARRQGQQLGGGSNSGNRNNRNHDRGTCVCMVLSFTGGIGWLAWQALASVLALDPTRFL